MPLQCPCDAPSGRRRTAVPSGQLSKRQSRPVQPSAHAHEPATQSPWPEQSLEDLHLNGGSKVSVCSTTVGSAKDLAANKKRERERGGLVVSYGMAMGWNNRMRWEAAH